MDASTELKKRADANTGMTPVREGFGLDIAKLGEWMAGHVPGFSGSLSVQQFKGGQSNPTYRLSAEHCDYVLRSKPRGPLLASAHAIDREFRVLSALTDTDVPVPRAYAYCEDETIIGRSFYVMSLVEGPVVWDLPTDRWAGGERARIWTAGVNVCAALHSVDPAQNGLTGFGKIGGYVARQYRRWSEQYLSKTRSAISNPSLDRLVEWLPAHLPEEEPTALVHGDLQLSNMIMAPNLDRVAGIIDWELSTLGNPISDFAYYCRDYHVPPEVGGFAGTADRLGIPDEKEMISLWTETTGYRVGNDWITYVIFNMFRLAAIRQGVAQRIKDGTAASSNAETAAKGAVIMADTAWNLAQDHGAT